VLSFAPVGWDGETRKGPGGEAWLNSTEFLAQHVSRNADVYVIYRAPQLVDNLPEGAVAWLICQDVDYNFAGRTLTQERLVKFTRIVAFCETHANYLRGRYPSAADKVVVSSNGIKTELIRELLPSLLVAPEVRNPKRLMYASSPDRGMEFLLDIFPRAKEIVPDLELHIYYGFDNIDKLKKGWIQANAQRLKEMTRQPGVTNHGRTPQPQLLREWFKSGIWCHPSNFTETSCITCMDAQACGAIPITQPTWAVGENVRHGVFIEGDVTNELVRSRYVTEVVKMALDPERQEAIRRDMMPYARERFTWERFVSQWEAWAEVDVKAEVAA
jgi:glycosyltransferase involved in cell wall biosynthesis